MSLQRSGRTVRERMRTDFRLFFGSIWRFLIRWSAGQWEANEHALVRQTQAYVADCAEQVTAYVPGHAQHAEFARGWWIHKSRTNGGGLWPAVRPGALVDPMKEIAGMDRIFLSEEAKLRGDQPALSYLSNTKDAPAPVTSAAKAPCTTPRNFAVLLLLLRRPQ